jgi:hypothetical protein
MSVRVASLVWRHYRKGGNHKLILLALADYANDQGGSIRPSLSTLAAKVGCSPDQTRRVLRELELVGLIETTANRFGGANKATVHRRILLDRLKALPPCVGATRTDGADATRTPCVDATPCTSAPPAPVHPAPCADATPPLALVPPNPSLNRQGTVIKTRSAKPRSRARSVEADPEFEQAWKQYPKRAGDNPKALAGTAWNARRREGVTAADLLAGVERYRRYCEATDRIGGEYVMQARTFFGKERRYAEPWEAPSRKGDAKSVESWVNRGI